MDGKRNVVAVLLAAVLVACSAEAPAAISPVTSSAPQTDSPLVQPTASAATTPPGTNPVTTPVTPTAGPATPAEPPPTLAPSTPGPDGWIGPDQIADGRYFGVAVVLDPAGKAHVAAVGRTGIWHLTNVAGDWTRERLTTTARHEAHDSVAIARDDSDGSLWVAYAQRADNTAPNFSSGISYVTNRGGGWSDPVDIPGSAERPILSVVDGVIHLASEDLEAQNPDDLGAIFRPVYITNATGDWAAVALADPGYSLAFQVSADGRVEMIFEGWQPGSEEAAIYRATRAGGAGAFEVQPIVEGLARYDIQAIAALDAANVPHLFLAQDDPPPGPRYVRGLGSGQTEPEDVPLFPTAAVVDARAAVHGVRDDRYLTNSGGSFVDHELDCGCQPNQSSIALDGTGRPHVVISSREGIWYGVGPGG